jgi:archaemetzincin
VTDGPAPERRGLKLVVAAGAVAVVAIVAVPVLLTPPIVKRRPPPVVRTSPAVVVPEGVWADGQPLRDERLSPALEVLKPLATPKRDPNPGEWLAEHPEPGQSVSDFLLEQRRQGWPSGRAFYLVTVGPVSAAEKKLLDDVRALVAAWYQRPVEWLEPVPASVVGPGFRRERKHGPQWQTTPILEALVARRPADTIALMAFTSVDLYPEPSWNYVFGQADPNERVGVTSLARLGAPDSQRARERTVATSVHELGHMLGLAHCVAFECVMNGSNSLEEADTAPLEPCPACLEKLRVRLDLDVQARAAELAPRWLDAGFPAPASQLAAAGEVWRDAGL